MGSPRLRVRPRDDAGAAIRRRPHVGESNGGPFGPIVIGPACIGNWEQGHEARYFRGKIDELAIFGRPLRADEVRDMYEQEKP